MAHLENQYGECVVELERNEYGLYKPPKYFKFDTLLIGDVYTVVADEEDEEDA